MKRSIFGKAAIFAVMLFLVGACSKGSAVEIGDNAPDFALNDINGKQANLSDFKGKVIVLDFFASWCPPCREEIPDFMALQNSYSGQGFSVIGVSLTDSNDTKNFADKMQINYPILVDDANKVSAIYGPIRSIPTTFVIGKDFKIARKYIGFRPKDVFENDIKELLK